MGVYYLSLFFNMLENLNIRVYVAISEQDVKLIKEGGQLSEESC